MGRVIAPPKMCPLLTTFQVVPRGFQARIIPVGEADVSGGADVMALIKDSRGGKTAPKSSLAGLGLGKKIPVYDVQGGFGIKTAPGTKPDDPDPKFVAEGLVVPCKRILCAFWSDEEFDCRLVSSTPASTLAAARALLTKATESVGEESSPKETEAP